jgi:hypothetical protein
MVIPLYVPNGSYVSYPATDTTTGAVVAVAVLISGGICNKNKK